jgi:hypothetical protein
MDAALNGIVTNLISKQLMEGTVTASIKITLYENRDHETGEIKRQMMIEPDVNMKIGAKLRLECSERGGIFLKQNAEGHNIIGDSQVSIDELLKEGDQE